MFKSYTIEDKVKLLILIVLVVGVFIYFKIRDDKLIKNGKYTLAHVEKIFAMKGGLACEYSYEVNSVLYTQTNYVGSSKVKNKKYFVVFSPQSPDVSTIFLEIHVPDSIYNKTETIWSKIPVKYDQKDYDLEFK